jgi:hydrogenase/urease accessory protein HupE
MYQSAVNLDFSGRTIHAEIELPLQRTELALNEAITSQTLIGRQGSLTRYLLSHFHAHSPNGDQFGVKLEGPITLENIDGAPYVVADLLMTAPNQMDAELFDVNDDILVDRIPSQVALVSIRSDWRSSTFANDPQLIGVINRNSRSVSIDRTTGRWFTGFRSIFWLGVEHIAEGTDHLLFLLALLLPAPLAFSRRRWSVPSGIRASLLRIFKIVTAFTIGHSITLALAALGVVHVPSRPIEVLIAVSILVSAIHALRPIFPGRENIIAAFFGLIHGLAFATTLGQLGLARWDRVASIFAFNIGIEAMQLIVVITTMPSLILLSRSRAYSAFRIGGALFAGLASAGWIEERLFNQHTPVDSIVDSVAHHAAGVAISLLFVSVLIAGFTWTARKQAAFAERAY